MARLLRGRRRPLVTVLELSGVIGPGSPPRRSLSLSRMEPAIEAAFKPAALKAVALAINSPGGSAAQSRLLYGAIRREAERRKVPVFCFVEDVAASGGYILALAADEIYADSSSIIGSIGVIAAGFGFQEAIARLGVERRIHTAGENKSQLDPFRPEDAEDVARLETILSDLHAQFVELVKQRRGPKLADHADIFTGAFWSGPAAQVRGLIDGIAHLGEFIRARYGEDVRLRRIAPDRGSLLRRIVGGEIDVRLDAGSAIDELSARSLWRRFGL
jgi:serine protease SohB